MSKAVFLACGCHGSNRVGIVWWCPLHRKDQLPEETTMADLDRELLDRIVRASWENFKKLEADSTYSSYDALDAVITDSVSAYLDAAPFPTERIQNDD